jgi:hypothetical protein
MKITMENVRRLARDFGPVGVVDRTGKIQQPNDSSADAWASVEQANTFLLAGSHTENRSLGQNALLMTVKQVRRWSANLP